MQASFPSKNVHDSETLLKASQAFNDEIPIEDLCKLGMDIQGSLRLARCDSPRIANDPAFRIVMIEIGQRTDVNDFANFTQCLDKIAVDQLLSAPSSERAKWADMAQSGATNLTPLMRSLFNSVTQVLNEGGIPHEDPAVRLIAHQMSYLSQTNSLKRDDPESLNLVSWCDASRAFIAVNDCMESSKAPSP